jgi:hypothetical protein
MMREVFRDYGAAIGPALAFVFGMLALAVKRSYDNLAARWDAERRFTRIIAMVAISPPPDFQGPPAVFSHTKDVMTNISNMQMFYDRLVSIKGAMDAADKPVHEHARPETILKFQKMCWYFEIIMSEQKFFRKGSGTPIPIEDNFFNIKKSWEGLLEASRAIEVIPPYKVLPPLANSPE